MTLARNAAFLAAAAIAAGGVSTGPALAKDSSSDDHKDIKHIVVIYEENHSFDNLYGHWEGVSGIANAKDANETQVGQSGTAYTCLKQVDVNLTSPTPLATTCTNSTTGTTFASAFTNDTFTINSFIAPTDTTCPVPPASPANGVLKGSGAPGGCTRDLVHRYYQEQYQLDSGKQDRYVAGSDAAGLSLGVYDTKSLPIYKYLHASGHPDYVIADDFFAAAFGGSFLNHQWLIAARTPTFAGALNNGTANDLHSTLDPNGMPTTYPLYTSGLPTAKQFDRALTQSCSPGGPRPPTQPAYVCGDYAVNTIQPTYQPYSPGTILAKRLPPLTTPTIGSELSAKGIDWAWYSGGWSNADGDKFGPGWTNGSGPNCSDPQAISTATFPNCPDDRFQFHHQPFNYHKAFDPGTAAGKANRTAHLKDEAEFISAVKSSTADDCNLKPVSFVKPIGAENEHPGYTGESSGSSHLVSLLTGIENSACRDNTMVIITYDEFGGSWDHVAPPGQGKAKGPHDVWGPGTRIPALILAPDLEHSFAVDHAQHDTTSILATIEHRFDVAPLGTRDAQVKDLFTVFKAWKGASGDE